MKCTDLDPLLAGYAADELAPAQREFVSLHVADCRRCQEVIADVRFTRTQLATVAATDYEPRVAVKVHAHVRRHARWLAWRPFALIPAQLAAAAMVVLLLGLSVWPRVQPGGSLPATQFDAQVGGLWVSVDTRAMTLTRRTPLPMASAAAWGARMLVLTPDGILAEQSRDGELRSIAPGLGGRLLTAQGDVGWLLRNGEGEAGGDFAIDEVDLKTGTVRRDAATRPGQVHSGVPARHGKRLFLHATVGERIYLKVFDPGAHLLDVAFPLNPSAFGESAKLLIPQSGPDVIIAGKGAFNIITGTKIVEVAAPDLTPNTVLVGFTMYTISPGGDLVAIDAASGATGTIIARYPAPPISELSLSPDARFLYGVSGKYLYFTPVAAPGDWDRVILP